MCAVVHQLPAIGFKSDHPCNIMDERREPSPQRRKQDTLPMRPGLSSGEPSKDDMELAQNLDGHAQGTRDNEQQPGQYPRGSHSPLREMSSPMSTSSTSDQNYDTPGSDREQIYAPVTSFGPDSVPSGQVCRWVKMVIASYKC